MAQKIIVLAIGNDIIGDDGAAFAAVNILKCQFTDIKFEFVYGSGLEILDMIEGYSKALVLDTISTGCCLPGTILEFEKSDFQYSVACSPHYMGLSEVLKLAALMEIEFPDEVKVLAIEIKPQNLIMEDLTPDIKEKLYDFIKKAEEILVNWKNEKH